MDVQKQNDNPLLAAALDYYRRGWCVIPIPLGTKKARIRWKQYQTQRPNESQIIKWFSADSANIAVVFGEASGGLSCRDYDGKAGIAEYKLWVKNHPDLAKQLPIVQTANGFHVYFEGNVEGCLDITDANGEHVGELRGSKCYCMLPPSVHPDGSEYQWANRPNGSILAVDPELAGFVFNVTQRTQENSKEVKKGDSLCSLCSLCNTSVGKAIKDTLPTISGTRHHKIFEFTRHLKTMPQYRDADPMQLKDIVREWHKQALPKIRTKEFEETWIDFLLGWKEVTHFIGEGHLAEIFNKAKQSEPPKIALEKFPGNLKLQLFVAFCWELQKEAGNAPFFLDCRAGARCMQVSHTQICRWFTLLVYEKIVELVQKGGVVEIKEPDGKTRKIRRASTYKLLM